MNIILIGSGIIIVSIATLGYACCVVSGRCSREEEALEWEQGGLIIE